VASQIRPDARDPANEARILAVIGEIYGLRAAVVHSLGVFVVSAGFFGCALLLSTFFNGVLRPLLITCLIALALGMVETFVPHNGVFSAMSAETYFRDGVLPWVGWLASAIVTGGLLYWAAVNVERRDF